MGLTIAEAIELLSFYKVGPNEDISFEELTKYESAVSAKIQRKNPGFADDELVIYTAYHILDLKDNKPGTGPIKSNSTEGNSYTVKDIKTSSYWMDCAASMELELTKQTSETDSMINESGGVTRADSSMPELSDGLYTRNYPDPNFDEV